MNFLSLRSHRGVQMKVVVLEKLQQKGQQRHCLHPSRRLKAETFWTKNGWKPFQGSNNLTLQGTNISHLGKRKIIFKYALSGGYVDFLEGTPFWGGIKPYTNMMVFFFGISLIKDAFFLGKYNDPKFLQSARKETKIFFASRNWGLCWCPCSGMKQQEWTVRLKDLWR